MNTPNAIWAIIIGAAIWIVQTYFGSVEWAGAVVAALIAVAKLIHVNLPESIQPTPQSDFGGPAPEQPSKVSRWLVG